MSSSLRWKARGAASLLLVALATGQIEAAPAPKPSIELHSLPDGAYSLKASIRIPAPPREVWDVVTDYDHLADFMPHFDASRVLSRDGDSVLVRQRGGSTFIITKHVDLTLSFHPFPPDSAPFRMLEGSIDRYAGVWRFERIEGGADSTRLTYEVEMGNFHIPGVILRHVIRRDIGEMMPAIAREVARRAAAHGAAPSR